MRNNVEGVGAGISTPFFCFQVESCALEFRNRLIVLHFGQGRVQNANRSGQLRVR